MSTRFSAAALAAILFVTPGDVVAETLVFFDENGGPGSPRGLYDFDTVTQDITLRSAVPGSERFFAMDRRLSDDTFFAVDWTGDLWTIDIDTGTPTNIGPTGIEFNLEQLLSIAVHPTTDEIFILDNFTRLHSVDETTGAASLIGTSGIATKGLVFSPGGDMLAFSGEGNLYSLNPANAFPTLIGGNNPAGGNVMEDATFTESGELYIGRFDGNIFQTDPVTGDSTFVRSTDMGIGMLAFATVPEPASGVLLLAGAFLLRRRSVRVPIVPHND